MEGFGVRATRKIRRNGKKEMFFTFFSAAAVVMCHPVWHSSRKEEAMASDVWVLCMRMKPGVGEERPFGGCCP